MVSELGSSLRTEVLVQCNNTVEKRAEYRHSVLTGVHSVLNLAVVGIFVTDGVDDVSVIPATSAKRLNVWALGVFDHDANIEKMK